MPNYKVVNADRLDADLTTVADAIRAKAGVSGKLEFPSGMADTVRSISSGGGVTLPELDNPAYPEDMVSGKSLYDHTGKKVDGSVAVLNELVFSKYAAEEDGIISSLEADIDENWLTLKTPPTTNLRYMLEKGSVVEAGVFLSDLGDAHPGDVKKGKTFTSSAGLKIEGTMESGSGGGGGLVVKTGTVTGEGAAQSIDTGLSSIKYFVVSTKSITAVGLVNLIVNADTAATAQAYCVYCSSKSQYLSTVMSGYGSSYFTITGGVITVGSGSSTNPASGVQYDWFAFGT